MVVPTNQGGPSSWVNGVYQDNLTCWAWGNPGYCGPNAIVRPGNNINFSFGMTDLYQAQAIANILPNSGTGLQVTGYNFGFTAKNGNGWDGGRLDYLIAYTTLYGADGSVAHNKSYNLNYEFNWTTFNFSESFSKPFAAKDLSSVRYGFVGMDTNYWAGPYGPEVYNVNFSLKYSVDQCSVDVLSSPSCPGYFDAITKLTPPVTSTTTTNTVSTTINPTIATTPTTPTTVTEISQPTTNNTTTTVVSPSIQNSTTSSSATPSATNPQPKIGEVTVSGSPAKTTISTSQALAIVRSEQARIGNLETSTTQQAVEQAQAASDKAQQESLSISATTISQSQASSQAAVSFGTPTTMSNQSLTQGGASGSVIGIQTPTTRSQSAYSLFPFTQYQTGTVVAIVSPQISYSIGRNESYKAHEETAKSEGIKFNSTNPIYNIINTPAPTQSNVQESSTNSSVNTKAKDNEIAGGVSIEAIAKQPRGFESYMGIIPDVAFYKAEELYRGQVTVDNVRALRQLSSDRLHQEMVNQQYRK